MTTVAWDMVGALASVAAVGLALLGGLAKWLVSEIRRNRETLDAVNRRVTTPDTVTGTIGEEVALIANRSVQHQADDDARIARLWRELGKQEPA